MAATKAPRIEPLDERLRREQLGVEDRVLEILLVAEGAEQLRPIDLVLEPEQHAAIRTALRPVAVEVDARVLEGRIGDVEHDHEIVSGPAPWRPGPAAAGRTAGAR